MDTLYSITLCFVVCLYEMHINCLADSRRLRIGHKKYRILRGPEQGVGVRQGPSCVSSLVPPGAGGPGRTPARPPTRLRAWQPWLRCSAAAASLTQRARQSVALIRFTQLPATYH